jgi:voltage-gated potassium channel Kch
MTALLTLAGVALIVVALRDIFQQLFMPHGKGSLAGSIMRIVWKAFRRSRALELGGPFVMLAVIGSWVLLLAVGWTLVLWPHMPEKFLFSQGIDPSTRSSFMDSLYLSLVTLTTLGYGDITPRSAWLRVLLPLEALMGFAVLTVSLAWVLSIYQVLGRRRAFAREVSLMRDSERDPVEVIERMGTEEAGRVLSNLTSGLVVVRGDLVQFPVTYYFHTGEERFSLSRAMPYLLYLTEKATSPDLPLEARFHAARLHRAIEDFSEAVGSGFVGLPSAPIPDVLEAYARDHARRVSRELKRDGPERD